jgi:hypothetical protein
MRFLWEELGSYRVDSHGGGMVCNVCNLHVGVVVAGLKVSLRRSELATLPLILHSIGTMLLMVMKGCGMLFMRGYFILVTTPRSLD